MLVNKTPSLPVSKTVSEQTVKSSKAQTAPQVKQSASPASVRSIASLVTASGLPADKLSSSIISFARFFSLPIKPEAMAEIRRQALSPLHAPQPEPQAADAKKTDSTFIQKTREGLSLAACAAESKSVELQQKALDSYADAIDPDRKKQDSEREKKNKNREQKEEKAEAITPASLKKMAMENDENAPLLYILNKLPAKNGQRWIVFPFNFSENEKEYRVSMRVLLEPVQTSARVVCMALDIVETDSNENKNRYSFVFEPENNQLMKLSAYIQNEDLQKDYTKFQNKLTSILEIPAENISVKILKDSFPCERGNTEEMFQSIDEAV